MTGNQNIYIVLAGVHERKVFDLYNILHKNHTQYKPLLFDYKDTAVSLRIVYRKKIHRLPNDSYEVFKTSLLRSLAAYPNGIFIYIPLLDNYNGLFYQFIQEYPGVLTCAIPAADSFNISVNKLRFQQFCSAKGLPLPGSFTKNDIAALTKQFKPLIVKPITGAGSVGISFIKSVAELVKLETINYDKYIVQERIDNIHVEGAFFLMDKGEVVSYYGHKRIRVFPETGGVTVYSSCHYNETLKDIGSGLLKELNWHGLAMVEFLYDEKTNDYKIIELNPRLWGSFLLSEFANTGFTENYIRLCLQQAVKEFVQQPGTKIRWFYPFDILLYIRRKGKIERFWRFDTKHTCYINFTYAGFIKACLYLVYFTFNINSIRRFFKKLSPANNQG